MRMNPARLNEWMQSPWKLEETQLEGLEKILTEFPYYTQARLLYLYGLWIYDRAAFDRQISFLPSLSLNASDISQWLFNTLPSQIPQSEPHDEQKKNNDETPTNHHVSLDDNLEVNSSNENRKEDFNTNEDNTIEKIIEADVKKVEHQVYIEKLNLNGTGIGNDVHPKVDDIGKDDTDDNQNTKISNGQKNFSEWLQSFKFKSTELQPKKEKEIKEPEIKTDTLNEKRKKQWDLFNKIIEMNPGPIKIKPGEKGVFYQPEKSARESLLESEDFVTETLANIYLEQGYYAKAIRVFEILSLKYPQKNSYFAEKIKEIRTIQKNKNL